MAGSPLKMKSSLKKALSEKPSHPISKSKAPESKKKGVRLAASYRDLKKHYDKSREILKERQRKELHLARCVSRGAVKVIMKQKKRAVLDRNATQPSINFDDTYKKTLDTNGASSVSRWSQSHSPSSPTTQKKKAPGGIGLFTPNTYAKEPEVHWATLTQKITERAAASRERRYRSKFTEIGLNGDDVGPRYKERVFRPSIYATENVGGKHRADAGTGDRRSPFAPDPAARREDFVSEKYAEPFKSTFDRSHRGSDGKNAKVTSPGRSEARGGGGRGDGREGETREISNGITKLKSKFSKDGRQKTEFKTLSREVRNLLRSRSGRVQIWEEMKMKMKE